MDYAEKSGLDQFGIDMRSWFTCYPGRPDYFTHWGGAFKYAASVLGLPIGDYPHSRPPQAELPAEGKAQTRCCVSAVRTGLQVSTRQVADCGRHYR